MARLTRKNIKVFAGNSNNNGVFGSLQANNPTLSNDVEQIQSLSAWGTGWNAATETSEELPPIEEMNSISYVTTYQQAYIMQEGIPEWASTVTFYKGSLSKQVTSTGFRIYYSLTNNNTGNALSDTTNWKKVMDSDDLYAYDSAVVKLTGNQTIAGTKTFSNALLLTNSGTDQRYVGKNSGLQQGTAPSSNTYGGFRFLDKNNVELGTSYSSYRTDGSMRTALLVRSPVAGSTNSAEISINCSSSGTFYTYAPTPTEDTTSSTQIDTVGARNTKLSNYALDNSVVKLSGNQTISGTKTFSTSPVAPTPASGDNSTKVATTAYVKAQGYALDSSVVKLSGNQTIAGTKTFSSSPVIPTPAVSDNSKKGATTAYINNKFKVVNSLPSSPDTNTFYFIKA